MVGLYRLHDLREDTLQRFSVSGTVTCGGTGSSMTRAITDI
jgi:hypothetical protein